MFDYPGRLQKLIRQLNINLCDSYLITDPIDLYYFTGLDLSAGKLLVTETSQLLIVDGRYFEACSRKSPFSLHLAEKSNLFELMGEKKTLGIDSEKTTLEVYFDLKKEGKNMEPPFVLLNMLSIK